MANVRDMGSPAKLGTKSITQNGTYNASSDNLDGYSQVSVNVPEATLGTKSITQNGTYNASSDNLDGYSQVSVNVEYTGVVLCGTTIPSNSLGNNEDLYVQYEDVSTDYKYGIVGIYRKVNNVWVAYVDPTHANSGVRIYTKSTSGSYASLYIQPGYLENNEWVATGTRYELDYHDAGTEVLYENIVGIKYASPNWVVTAKANVTDGTNMYSNGDIVGSWSFNTNRDIKVYIP